MFVQSLNVPLKWDFSICSFFECLFEVEFQCLFIH